MVSLGMEEANIARDMQGEAYKGMSLSSKD
jgi:hypothetical protein